MIAFDTHTLVWWITGQEDRFTEPTLNLIEQELVSGQIVVSSIISWEIAMLVERERLVISMDIDQWISKVSEIPALRFIPVCNEIAIKSVSLPGDFHKDPADRIIVATARKFACTLITADEKIRAYPHVRTVC